MDLGKNLNAEFWDYLVGSLRYSLDNSLDVSSLVCLNGSLRRSLYWPLRWFLWRSLDDSLRFSLSHSLEVFLKRRQK